MIIRVAEFLGIASYAGGAAAIPTDAHDLDLCKRLINDGYRRFIGSNPDGLWNFLQPTTTITLSTATTGTADSSSNNTLVDAARIESTDVFAGKVIRITAGTGIGQYRTITSFTPATDTILVSVNWTINPDTTSEYQIVDSSCVEGENWRYKMADGFYGVLLSGLTFAAGTGIPPLMMVGENSIRNMRVAGDFTGDPRYGALRVLPITPTASVPQWELLVHPTPSSALVITARVQLFPDKLSSNGDKHICGFQHDEAVMASAMASAELQRDDQIGNHEASFQSALMRSLAIDRKASPRNLGDYGDRSDDRIIGYRPYTGVDSYTQRSGSVFNF